MKTSTIYNTIIIGGGPAALTAAIYTARAMLKPLVFEGWMAGGVAAGGQLTTTSSVENFPGFPKGIQGPELVANMKKQAIKFGAEFVTETVESVNTIFRPFKVTTTSAEYQAQSVIIATGATAKRLGVDGEETYWDKGISTCAICDGALPIFRKKPLAVIGGGDAACEEAEFLTNFGSKVHIIVRRNVLRASKVMQERIFKNSKIIIHWNTEVTNSEGDGNVLKSISLIQNQTKVRSTLTVSGLFYAIGHVPNTAFLKNGVDTNPSGYIITQDNCTFTSVEGIFACGDVQDSQYRQAVTAAGSGCMAALDTEHWLTEKELRQ